MQALTSAVRFSPSSWGDQDDCIGPEDAFGAGRSSPFVLRKISDEHLNNAQVDGKSTTFE